MMYRGERGEIFEKCRMEWERGERVRRDRGRKGRGGENGKGG